jgi:hypothetical protein
MTCHHASCYDGRLYDAAPVPCTCHHECFRWGHAITFEQYFGRHHFPLAVNSNPVCISEFQYIMSCIPILQVQCATMDNVNNLILASNERCHTRQRSLVGMLRLYTHTSGTRCQTLADKEEYIRLSHHRVDIRHWFYAKWDCSPQGSC